MVNDPVPIDYESPRRRSNRAIQHAIVFTGGSFLTILVIIICFFVALQSAVRPAAIVIGTIASIGLVGSFVWPGDEKNDRERAGARIGIACGIALWALLASLPILLL
jgi:dipeptide/tripeptide permease